MDHKDFPTVGPLNPVDITITQAYTDQTRLLGWNNLLRGRLSLLWGKAFVAYSAYNNTYTSNSTGWLAKIIFLFWDYSLSV